MRMASIFFGSQLKETSKSSLDIMPETMPTRLQYLVARKLIFQKTKPSLAVFSIGGFEILPHGPVIIPMDSYQLIWTHGEDQLHFAAAIGDLCWPSVRWSQMFLVKLARDRKHDRFPSKGSWGFGKFPYFTKIQVGEILDYNLARCLTYLRVPLQIQEKVRKNWRRPPLLQQIQQRVQSLPSMPSMPVSSAPVVKAQYAAVFTCCWKC